MAEVDKAALQLTQCRTCAGCQRQEDDTFRGDDKCTNYRKAVEEPKEYQQGYIAAWRRSG